MNRLKREITLRLFQQMHQNDNAEWRRASGLSICPFCSLRYRDHNYDEETPLANEAYDNRLCDGTVVHL